MKLHAAPELLADLPDRISQARASQAAYDRHVAPIVAWAIAEYGSRRTAHDALERLRWHTDTSDLAYGLLTRAVTALQD